MQRTIGLSSAKAQEQQKQYGKNRLRDTDKVPLYWQILKQFLNPLILVLLTVAAISLSLGEGVEALVIAIVVVMNCLVGFFQERKAEHAVDSIKKLISLKSKVYRDNSIVSIEAEEIVPEDVVVLEAGDKVPADGRLIEAKNLQISESQLTGESYPVQKHMNDTVFMSTIVTNGRGVFFVEKTGMGTEIGSITTMVSKKAIDKAPLEQKFKVLTKRIIILVGFACVAVFIAGLAKGFGITEIFKASVSLGVSAIPEGLPVVVTITLAIGVYRMSRQNSIIKNLPSASTLAGIDVICTDKTGTITEGKIQLIDTYVFKSGELLKDYKDNHFMKLGVLCNDASISNQNETGDLLDIAILKYAEENNLSTSEVRSHHNRMSEIPFDSEYKYQATLNFFNENEYIIIAKGAFDVLIKHCNFSSEAEKENVLQSIHQLAEQGLRIIVIASKFTKSEELTHNDISGLDLNGVLVFIDPLRKDVHEAIEKCYQSGINTVMITGDHVTTARNIALQAGIATLADLSLDASELHQKEDILKTSLDKIAVIARATPLDKVRLINAFHDVNKTVAMTGDGVNDAPALVKADIGIAMGENGTDAAREAADMVLLDNKFSTIVKGIEEARMVYENLKKVVVYLFSTSLGEILTLFTSVILGLPLPLIAVQILWLNLVTDGFMTCAIALEEKQKGIMNYKPERYKKDILDNLIITRTFFLGIIMALGSVLIFQFTLKEESLEYARTSLLIVMAIFQWFNAFNTRSEDQSLLRVGIFKNKYIVGAMVLQALLLFFAVYTPFMQKLLHTVPVDARIWVYALGISFSIIIFEEIRKQYFLVMKDNFSLHK